METPIMTDGEDGAETRETTEPARRRQIQPPSPSAIAACGSDDLHVMSESSRQL